MKDVIDPFLSFATVNADYNEDDHLAETARLVERQGVIHDWLSGQTEAEHVLDTLSDQGLNPDTYVAEVCRAVEFAINGGIVFESNDSGLFLPVT